LAFVIFRPINIGVHVLVYLATAAVAYLLGSIPTGFLMAKARGIDIRTVGSGNIGATNAFRILGKGAGVFVLLVDALKGWIAVAVAAPLLAQLATQINLDVLRIIAALMAVVGHNFTCWLRFKGGKGIATSAGVLVALVPWALLIIAAVWVLFFLVTRYVSLASIAASASLPFATWFTTNHNLILTVVTSAMTLLAIYRHRLNIQRLLKGTESRAQFKRKEAQ
jgi:acyl phosphate:glycerol-3-phosphate acyltransferase